MNSSSFLEWIAVLLICCVSLTAIYDPPGASARCAVQYPTASPRYFISPAGSDLQSEATIRDMMLHDWIVRQVDNYFDPTGKSQKPVQPHLKKYSAFAVGQISATSSRHPVPARGTLRGRHGRWERDAVDAAVHETSVTVAYGEVVWFWRPDAGVKFVRSYRFSGATVTTKPVTGESAL